MRVLIFLSLFISSVVLVSEIRWSLTQEFLSEKLKKSKSLIQEFLNRRKIKQQWPHALFLMVGSLKSGLTLEDSLQVMIYESPEPLRSILIQRNANSSWKSFLVRTKNIFKEEEFSLMRASLALAYENGGQEARLLESSAKLLLKKIEVREKILMNTTQSRLSAWVVGAAPFVFLLLIQMVSPEFIAPLFHTAQGRLMLLGVGCSILVGVIWIFKLTRFDL